MSPAHTAQTNQGLANQIDAVGADIQSLKTTAVVIANKQIDRAQARRWRRRTRRQEAIR